MWQKPIVHDGLNAFRMVRGSTEGEVETKARLQLAAWSERWKRKQEIEAIRQNTLTRTEWRERQVDMDCSARAVALERTKEAERGLDVLDNLLQAALVKSPGFDWNQLSDLAPFSKSAPVLPQLKTWPREPQKSDPFFQYSSAHVELSILDWLIPPLKRSKQATAQAAENVRRDAANQQFKQAHDAWQLIHDDAERYNAAAKLIYAVAQAAWLKEKESYEDEQRKYNVSLGELRTKYLARVPEAIARFSNEVLAHSAYPDSFPRDSVASFDPATEMLIVDFELPPEIDFPRLKQVKYVATRQEFQDVIISDADFRRVYDSVLYQICFRSLHEIFWADEINAICSIVFNGWVRAVDKATGVDTHPCILSVQVKKATFKGSISRRSI
jgi:restriction system protein